MILIEYGIPSNKIDVTDICKERLVFGNHIIIPSNDYNRAMYFTDPLSGIHKSVFITVDKGEESEKTIEYPQHQIIYIATPLSPQSKIYVNDEKIEEIHRQLSIQYGSFQEELPEQRMALRYLTGAEKILEIGGNIGRNSMIIAHILREKNENGQLVTMECDTLIAEQLRENRDANQLDFAIEIAALSKRRLIQQGWNTTVIDDPEMPIPDDYKEVATIDFQTLETKHNIVFDTLVLDCEGAFYYILKDMPYMLDNIRLIIMENDYFVMEHKNEINTTLTDNDFYLDYQEGGGWGPCGDCFFEVWKRYPARLNRFPITFSIPECKIIRDFSKKPNYTKLISDIIPSDKSTYIYNTEEEYYAEYQSAIFAHTKKKAGWDCLRHYEIIANGCIPYFPEIDQCPPNTLHLFPKALVKEANELYVTIKETPDKQELTNIGNLCQNLRTRFLQYIKDRLTTKQIAKYILTKTNSLYLLSKPQSKILFLSGNIEPDYLRCLTLHGFKQLFQHECHDYPKIPHLYKGQQSDTTYNTLYGKGFTYTGLLEEEARMDVYDQTVEEDIKSKAYDLIIYGSYTRGMPFYELVKTVYQPNEVILLYGEDYPVEEFDSSIENHPIFIRESR